MTFLLSLLGGGKLTWRFGGHFVDGYENLLKQVFKRGPASLMAKTVAKRRFFQKKFFRVKLYWKTRRFLAIMTLGYWSFLLEELFSFRSLNDSVGSNRQRKGIMLKWRLTIGLPTVLVLALLFWGDAQSPIPGLFLMPPFLVCVFFLCREFLSLLNAGGLYPRRSTVFAGTLWIMIWCWLACYKTMPHIQDEGWNVAAKACLLTLLAMAGGILIAFTGEMARFKYPGGNTINLAGAIFAIAYIGVLGCFMIMLRIAYGVGAMLSLIITTKMCDIGAYTVGHLIGKHKMAADLSPGKTVEGLIGGLVFAVFGAWISIDILLPYFKGFSAGSVVVESQWAGVVLFGLFVGLAGAVGDLAESLIKRDVRRKDSGSFVPGFGGFLDIFDSLLLAGPVAFGMWAFQLVR